MLIEKSKVMIVPLRPPIFIRPPISLVKCRTVVGKFQLLGMELIGYKRNDLFQTHPACVCVVVVVVIVVVVVVVVVVFVVFLQQQVKSVC